MALLDSLFVFSSLLVIGLTAQSVSDAELRQLSEHLFQLDVNNQASAVRVDLQGRTFSSRNDDQAPRPLLQVSPSVLQVPTIALLRDLYDNYERDTLVTEHVTPQERQEQSDFLDAVLSTPALGEAMDYLADNGLVPADRSGQKAFLDKLWFSLYSRGGGRVGSSAFEHVFLGEMKHGEVSGFHSWVFFNHEEDPQYADYKGYMKALNLGESGSLVKLRFSWHDSMKPTNSLLVGTSPELELALYTVCFMTRPGAKCPLSANGKNFFIQTWPWTLRGGGQTIGSAYPDF